MRTRLDLLVICALSLYRAWRLVARDKITERWREQLYDRWPPNYKRSLARTEWNPTMREVVFHTRPEKGKDRRRPVNVLASSLDCPWCLPSLIAAVATVAVDASFGLTWPVAWWGALGALVGFLGRAEAK